MIDRRTRIILGAILLVGLAARLWHVLALRGDILFDYPPLDEDTYVRAARALAAGQVFEAKPYWQPPGLLYALCAIFRFTGRGLLAPRIVQALVSTACVWLVFALARRWFTTRVALVAAGVVALHGVLVFEAAELLPATWIAFFNLVLLLALVRERALLAGIALGVSVLMTPAILPFGIVGALWLRRPARILAFAAGALLVIAPVTLRNHRYGGEWVLVSTNGGVNFYIGNNADYPATVEIRPGRHWQALWTEPDRLGILRPGEASSYFVRKALAFVHEHPLREAGLLLRKLYLFANGAEIPRDTDLYAARAQSPVLRLLVWPAHFPDGLLIPLALVGVALAWPRRRELFLPLGFLLVQALMGAAFFVTSRHRVPALMVLAPLAAFGALELVQRRSVALAGGLAALVVVLNLPMREAKASYAAELDFYRGLAELRERHDTNAAVRFFQQSTASNGNDERAWFELGNALDAMGRTPEAIDAWSRAAALDPSDARPNQRAARAHLDLGISSVRKGDYGAAIEHLRSAEQALKNGPAIHDPAFLRAFDDLVRETVKH